MENKPNILLLAGGLSDERDVSLSTASAIYGALKRLGYETKVLDSATGKSLLDGDGNFLLKKDDNSLSKIAMKRSETIILSERLQSDPYKETDLVFIGLHGGSGEDGTIQALLDMANIKYTGSGMLASALAMNKAMAKKLVTGESIPTPDFRLFRSGEMDLNKIAEVITKEFSLPVIIKPNDSGSTCGLTLVKSEENIIEALTKVYAVSDEVLVEDYTKGREITSAVLDGESYPLVEIIPSNELYDYDCKYTKGKSQYICPAKLSDEVATQITAYARKVYEILGCSGLARVDFILDKDDTPWFLELNTLPGMTELSLAPMAAKEAGFSFDQLIEKICQSALK